MNRPRAEVTTPNRHPTVGYPDRSALVVRHRDR